MKIPDLLFLDPYLGVDRTVLEESLGLAFHGRELGTTLHDELARARMPPRDRLRKSPTARAALAKASTDPVAEQPSAISRSATAAEALQPQFFSHDLFLRGLLEQSFTLELDGRSYPVNHDFLERVLQHAPVDPDVIALRQGILRELDESPTLLASFQQLYRELFDLMSLLKTPGFTGGLDLADFRLDILRQLRQVIDFMADRFVDARSGLRRLHECALETRERQPYRLLADLLEYESGLARMSLDVTVGADGRLRSFVVQQIEENTANPFYRTPGRRFFDRLRLAYRGYSQGHRELMNRLVNEVFRQLSDPMVPYVQLVGHLEFYLTSQTMRARATARGLDVCLPELREPGSDGQPGVEIDQLFNPLLLSQHQVPVPCSLSTRSDAAVVLITGPNSGGKTRLLQALGLCQVLAQSGTFVPARSARLQLQRGLFVSLIEEEGARATEGRLGRELVRIRSLFETMEPHSLVILDELCSGTNPSEGVEVFTMVLRLLHEVRPTAYVTTHFLDYARSLSEQPVIDGLEFLQVEVDESLISTYQFVPGVAETSLAAVTAQRLGVTFDRLAHSIRQRRQSDPDLLCDS